ncbi:bifunctional hydroxymethylpyrimidine kinase/phosphomethylpyrimidine kinase [Streptococcus pyogenes]|nr:bifunctional hydroxymethylpyrimidine kinase/phosphomethylpyrimidine kinase [Streptococcus pyogenes]
MKTDYIVTISGNDILSGGGLYADLATYIRYDLQAFVAVTCLTTRSEEGFSLFPVAKEIFRDQLNSFTNAPISAIKIGLLPNAEMCEIVLDFIKGHLGIPVVLDPVLACKEIDDVKIVPLRQEILQLLPYVTVVTPNLVEAQLLSQKEIVSLKDMQEAAKYFYQLGAKQVVIKGGNRFSQKKAIDLFSDGKEIVTLECPVLEKNNIGAGCTFASSIASQLVKKKTPLEAVKNSKELVYQAILQSDRYGVKQSYAK